MRTRQSKRGHVIIAALWTAAAVLYVSSVAAQAPQNPPRIGAGPWNPPPLGAGPRAERPLLIPRGLTAEQVEAFKKEFADYQQCTRDNADEMRLSSAADNVISLRDRRAFWEAEFQRNTTLRLQWGEYAQAVAAGFQEYKSLGGPAPTLETVQPIKPPCTNPVGTTTGPRIPITDSKKMTIPAP